MPLRMHERSAQPLTSAAVQGALGTDGAIIQVLERFEPWPVRTTVVGDPGVRSGSSMN